MGCVASRIDKKERVRICRERKNLMKQLLGYRKEFADSQLAYLRALRNTGATLRQFTESELLEIEETNSSYRFPPSPPPPLPPSPPPPPQFSPDLRKFKKPQKTQSPETLEIDENITQTPPPPIPSSNWDYWDPFGSPPNPRHKIHEIDENENWVDTNSEFLDEDEDEEEEEDIVAISSDHRVNLVLAKDRILEPVDDDSSMLSWHTKDTEDTGAMVVFRSGKNLTGVVKDMDEYFLKGSGMVKDIAVLIDITMGDTFLYQSSKENKRKSNPAKVFSSLTWSWSSKSLQFPRETGDHSGEPCKPGAHCITLQKLYSEEKKLYKNVKEEENSKFEYGRKSLLLQRQEEEHDFAKTEKTRSTVESLESYILSLQESITTSYSTISKLINEELHPQMITLASGLTHMWQTMHHCHQIQYQISQHLNHLNDQNNPVEPTTEYHRQAAAQLQAEVSSWYNSFNKLVKFQQEYARALCKWAELTDSLVEIKNSPGGSSSTVHALAREWVQALEKLPDKMVSESIKNLLSSVQAIVSQQQEECNMRKRSDKLVRRLERDLTLLSELEMKFEGSLSLEDANNATVSKHPLLIRRYKVEALKLLVDEEKGKYVNSVKMTRAMILNKLKMSLPKVFQALIAYSGAYAQSFGGILGTETVSECEDA